MLEWLFGKKKRVILIDFDGEVTIANAFEDGKKLFAYRLNKLIQLLPDGKARGWSVVKEWEPLDQ